MNMQVLREAKASLAMAATAGRLDPRRFYSAAYTQLHTNEDIRAKCTPRSILFALQKCANAGLYPDGHEAYLVPFGNKCTFLPGYKGLIKRFAELPTAADLPVRVDEVRENDQFDYRLGDDPYIKHVYGEGSIEDRGEVTHFYCIFNFRDGSKAIKVMTFEEVDEYKKFSKQKPEKKQFWYHPAWEVRKWMYFKAILRQTAKLLPLSADLAKKLELEERIEQGAPVPVEEMASADILEGETADHGFAEPEAVTDLGMSHQEADQELADQDEAGKG